MVEFPEDIFSTAIRKEFLWSELLRLTHLLSVSSLIHSRGATAKARAARLKELEKYESEKGFVYFGEKHWLSALQNGNDISYADWVSLLLSHQKQVCYGDSDLSIEQCERRNGGSLCNGMIVGSAMPRPVRVGDRYSCFHDDCGMRFSIWQKTAGTRVDQKFLVQIYHLMHNFGYYAEKAVEFFLWRGDKMEEGEERTRWESLGLRTDLVDSKCWEAHLGECGVRFFEHDVCVALACDNGQDDLVTENYADTISQVIKSRTESGMPFWC